MPGITSLFDSYGLRARLLPTLLVVLPPVAVVAILFPNIYSTVSNIFGALGIVAVTLFLLAHVIRGKGRDLERRLYLKWGGKPTTAWLRHQDMRLDPITKARYHQFLERMIGTPMPTPEAERSTPEASDHAYSSAVKWLLEYTRDASKFQLVFEENVSYGFRRNTLASKPLALFSLLPFALLLLGYAYIQYGGDGGQISSTFIVATIIVTLDTALWISLVNEDWVRDGSDAYARALLASCEARALNPNTI